MVWRNEGEVDGLARVRAKRWQSGIELIASYRKGKSEREGGGDSGEGVGRMGV